MRSILFFSSLILGFAPAMAAPCPTGSFSASGQTPCTPCAAGTFAAFTGSTACTPCPVGNFQATTGQTTCVNCTPGSAQPAAGATTCVACAADEFQDNFGAANCLPCAMGLSSGPGANVCVATPGASACGPGTYEDGMLCPTCPAGTSGNGIDGHCTVCRAGTFVDMAGMSTCALCTPGKSTNDAIGLTGCIDCAVGHAAGAGGSAACTACAAGRYADAEGLSACTRCAAGTYAAGTGNTACDACAPGTAATDTGSSACTACRKNTFAAGEGASACESCAAGTVADPGAVECVDEDTGEPAQGGGCAVRPDRPAAPAAPWLALLLAAMGWIALRAVQRPSASDRTRGA